MCAAILLRLMVQRLLVPFTLLLALAYAPFGWSTTGPVNGTRCVVASNSILASQAGVRMIEQGGNAIDAAVATGFALAVTHPTAGNLGGGGFMVIRLADGSFVANDHREKAPALATRDMFLDEDGNMVPGLSTASHLASGVPGTVAGLIDVLERHGRLSLAEVLAPAIELADEGIILSVELAASIERHLDRLSRLPAGATKFTKNGTPYSAGEIWRQPHLAATLRRIAEHGKAGFYDGETADLIVAEMQRGGGLISYQDLDDYQSVWREPISGTYKGFRVHSMPPPSSGGVLLVQLLNMLEGRDLASSGWNSRDSAHAIIEAERRAYADRASHLGDADFYPVPIADLVSKDYARQRMQSFNPERATPSSKIEAGTWHEGPDTTHVSVIDAEGNAVAYTTTINLGYGSKIVVQGAGFLLNNEMDDFAAAPGIPNAFGLLGSEANAIAPEKRMLSSMTPTIVINEEQDLMFVTGSPGGSTIITTVLQVVLNLIEYGMSPDEAVAAARFHHQWQPDAVVHEAGAFSDSTREALTAMGHLRFREIPRIGSANSAISVGRTLQGLPDPRQDTGAAGL